MLVHCVPCWMVGHLRGAAGTLDRRGRRQIIWLLLRTSGLMNQ